MALVATTLAALRMAVGVSLLAVPKFTATTFLVPFDAATTTFAARLTGSRDFAVGALLYASRLRRTPRDYNPTQPREDGPLLKDNQSQSQEVENLDAVRRALIAGLLVDGLDIVSALWSYFEGTLPIGGFGAFGGGALLFFVMGAFSLYRLRLWN